MTRAQVTDKRSTTNPVLKQSAGFLRVAADFDEHARPPVNRLVDCFEWFVADRLHKNAVKIAVGDDAVRFDRVAMFLSEQTNQQFCKKRA